LIAARCAPWVEGTINPSIPAFATLDRFADQQRGWCRAPEDAVNGALLLICPCVKAGAAPTIVALETFELASHSDIGDIFMQSR